MALVIKQRHLYGRRCASMTNSKQFNTNFICARSTHETRRFFFSLSIAIRTVTSVVRAPVRVCLPNKSNRIKTSRYESDFHAEFSMCATKWNYQWHKSNGKRQYFRCHADLGWTATMTLGFGPIWIRCALICILKLDTSTSSTVAPSDKLLFAEWCGKTLRMPGHLPQRFWKNSFKWLHLEVELMWQSASRGATQHWFVDYSDCRFQLLRDSWMSWMADEQKETRE